MHNFRQGCILLLNLAVGAWLVEVGLLDESSDAVGLFTLVTLCLLGVYDGYAWVLYQWFKPQKPGSYATETQFVLFLVLPFVLLWGLTS
ncbi:hypothetical protein [Hymenobacter ruricola]|uniref:Uncharacterized protein n=1 Tax=Hymenobacter ruricola TaxID=2791023 RepID=A0ABS0I4V0_9BACT|nr:hypothetical protein [Hymenobacter ruricola]MBF9221579.1 hypothetical protein [Hymenobacter ruricola]